MDPSLIVDYGQHSVKHGVLQLQKRGAAGGSRGKTAQQQGGGEQQQQQHVAIAASRDSDCRFNMDVSAVAGHVAELAREAGLGKGSAALSSSFSLSFLTHPLLAMPARELLLQCIFEDIKPQRVFLGYSPVCALFASGATSAIVVDVGHFRTTVVPVAQGVPLTPLTAASYVGGAAVDAALVALLRRHHVPHAALTRDLLQSIKALHCVAHPTEGVPMAGAASAASKPLVVPLPDGQAMRIPLVEADYVTAGSALFEPAGTAARAAAGAFPASAGPSFGFEPSPLHLAVDVVRATLLEAEEPCRSLLVTGGASMMRGVCDAIGHALTPAILPGGTQTGGGGLLHRRPLKDRDSAGWAGACILTHLGSFPQMCVDAAQYAEEGPRRCLKVRTVDQR